MITELLTETYKQLSVAVSLVKGYHISAGSLWEKTDALLADAVSKKLKIEGMIATSLESDYEPVHLLYKTHTVEKLDTSNLNVLSRDENSVNKRQTLEDISPSFFKFFFHGKKTTVEAVIDPLITLVSQDKSGKSESQADSFDCISKWDGVRKCIFLYQQCRLAKLGKGAASIAQTYPMLKRLLSETTSTNQLVEACKIYLSSKLFFT